MLAASTSYGRYQNYAVVTPVTVSVIVGGSLSPQCPGASPREAEEVDSQPV